MVGGHQDIRGTARYEDSIAVKMETVSFCNMAAPYHHCSALRMESGFFKNVAYFCHTTRCHIP
jgi:hypothetical protein